MSEYRPTTDNSYYRYPYPIILLHGMWGSNRFFGNFVTWLTAKGFRVITIDLPYHQLGVLTNYELIELGKAGLMSYIRAVGAVVSFIGPCVLIGHSMGGLIALKVTERNKNIKAIVSLMGAPPRGIPLLNWEIFRRLPVYIGSLLLNRSFQLEKKDALQFLMNRIPVTEQNYWLKCLCPESGKAARQLITLSVGVKKISVPLLVVSGLQDQMIPARIGMAIVLKYKGMRLLTNHGHMPMIEPEWKSTLEKIIVWMETIP